MMLMNIFSVFDPCTSMSWSLNWGVMLIILMMFPNLYWMNSSRFHYIYEKFVYLIFMEFKVIVKFMNLVNMYVFVCLFMILFFINFMGLFPYIYTLSSSLVLGLSYSLVLWMSFMLYGWLNFFDQMFIHLVPLNTPMALIIFMILIETISNFIRPGTLAIRLLANMVAGHLLLGLLGGIGFYLNILGVCILILIQLMLYILEIFVSMIQGYVFSVLLLLYMDDVSF